MTRSAAPPVHQLLSTATPGDAVTGQALAWSRLLESRGIHGEVVADRVATPLAPYVRRSDAFALGPADRVVLHYSIWSPIVDWAFQIPRERLAVCYHNVTPGHFFDGVNPAVASLCDQGRAALPRIGRHAGLVIADSLFNAEDLRAAGASAVQVVPLLLDLPAPRLTPVTAAPRVLTVGRIAPNKRIEDALRAFALLTRHFLPNAHFDVIGSAEGFERYLDGLRAFAVTLGIDERVTFHGRVGDETLARAFETAGVYLCMSEHEGFCVPLVEALNAGVPVVARGAAAIPETLGGAGLVLPSAEPAVAAEALNLVLTEPRVREVMGREASRRLTELHIERVESLVMNSVTPFVGFP